MGGEKIPESRLSEDAGSRAKQLDLAKFPPSSVAQQEWPREEKDTFNDLLCAEVAIVARRVPEALVGPVA